MNALYLSDDSNLAFGDWPTSSEPNSSEMFNKNRRSVTSISPSAAATKQAGYVNRTEIKSASSNGTSDRSPYSEVLNFCRFSQVPSTQRQALDRSNLGLFFGSL